MHACQMNLLQRSLGTFSQQWVNPTYSMLPVLCSIQAIFKLFARLLGPQQKVPIDLGSCIHSVVEEQFENPSSRFVSIKAKLGVSLDTDESSEMGIAR